MYILDALHGIVALMAVNLVLVSGIQLEVFTQDKQLDIWEIW